MTSKHPVQGLRVDVPTREPGEVLLHQLTQLSTASTRSERRVYPKVLAAAASVAALAATTWLAGAVPGTTSPLVPTHHRQGPSQPPSPSPSPSERSPGAGSLNGVTTGSGVVPSTTPDPSRFPHPHWSTPPGRPGMPGPSTRFGVPRTPHSPHGGPQGWTTHDHGAPRGRGHHEPRPGDGRTPPQGPVGGDKRGHDAAPPGPEHAPT